MTYSIYEELKAMAGSEGLAFRNKVIEMGIGHIFDYAWNKHHPAGNFPAIVLYTVYTYSWESRMVRLGKDWLKTKISIAQKVELPQYLYDDLVHLKDHYLADCCQEFLHLYRDNIDYVHLTSIKELYQQIMSAATRYKTDDDDKSDSPDLESKFKNLSKASELKDQIKDMEAVLTAKYRILQAAKSDFKYDHLEHGNPLKLENSPLIKG